MLVISTTALVGQSDQAPDRAGIWLPEDDPLRKPRQCPDAWRTTICIIWCTCVLIYTMYVRCMYKVNANCMYNVCRIYVGCTDNVRMMYVSCMYHVWCVCVHILVRIYIYVYTHHKFYIYIYSMRIFMDQCGFMPLLHRISFSCPAKGGRA